MYEVSISGAYAMTMAALAALWCSLTTDRHRLAWTALSSVLFGLAVGARPTFLFGAVSLAIPIVVSLTSSSAAPAGRHGRWMLGLAAFAPIAVIGAGLAAYNYFRFGDPFEFGIKYLMMGKEVTGFFGLNWRYIWLNAEFYFFLPTKLMAYFPFVRGVDFPPFPPGYGFAENPYGIFPNIPFLLMAFAAPVALFQSQAAMARNLKWFVSALVWVSMTSVAVLLVYVVATIRYELDFTPYLTLLAVLGVFGIEARSDWAPKWRSSARVAWIALLAASCAFNFFGSCQHLDVLKKDAPAEFQALSTFFDLPVYCYHRYLAPKAPAPAKIQSPTGEVTAESYGAISESLEFPDSDPGSREPLLVIGGASQNPSIAFIRSAGRNRIAVGFDFPGVGSIESRPIEIEGTSPIDVAIFAPQLLPDLGYSDWNGASFGRQLSDLGLYRIFVNHTGVLQVSSPLGGPLDRDSPLVIGANPLTGTSVSSRFTGKIVGLSRLQIGDLGKAPSR
jgi:hypothetical protein